MGFDLHSLIRVHDDVLPPETCRFLIDFFETNPGAQERIDDAKRPSFTQVNFTEAQRLTEEATQAHELVLGRVLGCRKAYYDFVDSRCFPPDNDFEQFRIKKYRNDGQDLFDTHVDVRNRQSSGRYLAFLFYLNDVAEGGETIFFPGMSVKPKAGRVVVFPPLWMYPHKGCAPVSNEKYIMSTYLLYK